MKNKILVLLLSPLLLTGCGVDQPDEVRINQKQTLNGSKEAATFIVECARAANPLSDEEGEDLVDQCERTAEKIYGKTYFSGYFYREICRTPTYKETEECLLNRGYVVK